MCMSLRNQNAQYVVCLFYERNVIGILEMNNFHYILSLEITFSFSLLFLKIDRIMYTLHCVNVLSKYYDIMI